MMAYPMIIIAQWRRLISGARSYELHCMSDDIEQLRIGRQMTSIPRVRENATLRAPNQNDAAEM